jgi:hypothetical protein
MKAFITSHPVNHSELAMKRLPDILLLLQR